MMIRSRPLCDMVMLNYRSLAGCSGSASLVVLSAKARWRARGLQNVWRITEPPSEAQPEDQAGGYRCCSHHQDDLSPLNVGPHYF